VPNNNKKQGNRRYQTSPALCNLITLRGRPHRLRPKIFILNDMISIAESAEKDDVTGV